MLEYLKWTFTTEVIKHMCQKLDVQYLQNPLIATHVDKGSTDIILLICLVLNTRSLGFKLPIL